MKMPLFRALGCSFAIVAMPFLAQAADRVLAIGGSVTEIVYALGEESRLIGRDSTSTFPAAANDLPNVGYMRSLAPEGVLSVGPELILAEEGSGPQETIDVLSAAELDFVTVPDGYDGAAVVEKIEVIAEALGVPEKGQALIETFEAELATATGPVTEVDPPRVMFILTMQGGRVMASGVNTAADGIIELAGGENAIDSFEGYKPLSDEAVAAAAPDVILMMDRGDHAAANSELFSHPALSITPAAQSNNVVRLNGLLLLGFGPRTPEAVRALSEALGTASG